MSNNITIEQFFDNIEIIGEGGQGKVYKCVDKKTNQIVAIKTIHIYEFSDDIISSNSINDFFRQKFEEEIYIIKKLYHINIVSYIDSLILNNLPYLVMEYCDTSLRKQIIEKINIDIKTICIDVLHGLFYLHTNKIIHRDLKPENILFKDDKYKISDFGLSKYLKNSKEYLTQGGTILYIAPEALVNKQTFKSDIWSFGVILIEILNGFLPERKTLEDTTTFINIINEKCSIQWLKDVLVKVFNINKKQRPDVFSLLKIFINKSLKSEEIYLNNTKVYCIDEFFTVSYEELNKQTHTVRNGAVLVAATLPFGGFPIVITTTLLYGLTSIAKNYFPVPKKFSFLTTLFNKYETLTKKLKGIEDTDTTKEIYEKDNAYRGKLVNFLSFALKGSTLISISALLLKLSQYNKTTHSWILNLHKISANLGYKGQDLYIFLADKLLIDPRYDILLKNTTRV